MNFQTVGYDGHGGAAAEQRVLGTIDLHTSCLRFEVSHEVRFPHITAPMARHHFAACFLYTNGTQSDLR